jgi:hypothetical protein
MFMFSLRSSTVLVVLRTAWSASTGVQLYHTIGALTLKGFVEVSRAVA